MSSALTVQVVVLEVHSTSQVLVAQLVLRRQRADPFGNFSYSFQSAWAGVVNAASPKHKIRRYEEKSSTTKKRLKTCVTLSAER